MKREMILMGALVTLSVMAAHTDIPAVDVHSHVVTDSYLKYLADNNALRLFSNED